MRFREADIRIARSLLAVYKPAAMANALAQSEQLISVEDYLEGEKHSEIKHEYVSGYVYAMAGASDDHNRIVGNLFAALHACLRGKRCEPFGSDMKLKLADSQVFYYPDLMVTCDTADNAKYFRERPTILFEVLSPETERIDQRGKGIRLRANRMFESVRHGLPGKTRADDSAPCEPGSVVRQDRFGPKVDSGVTGNQSGTPARADLRAHKARAAKNLSRAAASNLVSKQPKT
jgi:Uma2 family endonuclease